MFRHYLVATLRSLAHHRLYTLINVVGLSIALTAAILIVLYVRDELSYDKWIPHTQDLYRLEETSHIPGLPVTPIAMASFPLVTAIGEKSPQVKAVTHVVPEWITVSVGDREFREQATFVDANFFRVIQLPLVRGDPAQALAQPESVVISQRIARKYFGDADPMGKTLNVSKDPFGAGSAHGPVVHPLTVTGVVRDLPHDTQLLAELVVTNTSRADRLSAQDKERSWRSTEGDYGYIELRPGANPAAVLTELKSILDASWNPRAIGVDLSPSELQQYRLTPFLSVHLVSDKFGGMAPGGSWTTVYGLSAIALLIVLIACFNFINLSTARATLRAREIALRKLVGAARGQLIAQLLLEAVLTALVSLAIALALVEVLLPLCDRFTDKTIAFSYLADWRLVAALIGGAIGVGLVSGSYPGIVLSAFRPAAILKPGARELGSSALVRSGLVVAQFTISITLGIATLVVFKQIDFVRNLELGFDHGGVVIVRGISQLTPSAQKSFAATLSTDRQVRDVAYSNAVPLNLWGVGPVSIRATGGTEVINAYPINAEPAFFSLYGAQLIAGRLLSEDRGDDVSGPAALHNMLINAAAARQPRLDTRRGGRKEGRSGR